jgi:hypothetical protein
MHKEQNGIIMVESAPLVEASAPITAAAKKKNKKKKAKQEENNVQQQQDQGKAERMVTLKNPMFFNNPAEPMASMVRNVQTPPFVSPLAPEPQAASIIRNENGIYTIRNPSFQNSFAGGSQNSSPAFAPRPPMEPIARPTQFAAFEGDAQPKCNSVIGSEMKNVLQRRKEQEFQANMQFGMRQPAGYSHFGGSGVNFNNNFNNNGTNCDDGFGGGGGGFPSYYDDLRLQPGQMLNSEVSFVIICVIFNIFQFPEPTRSRSTTSPNRKCS